MSRLIVKNLPKHLTEEELARHFAKDAKVTDAKIMMKNGRSRLFGFVGFKSEEEAKKAKEYFNNTYLHTSKLSVDLALAQNDTNLARPWSKHSQGSSSFKRLQKATLKDDAKMKKATVAASEVEQKKQRFREFLKVMGKGASQSWNDNFDSFME